MRKLALKSSRDVITELGVIDTGRSCRAGIDIGCTGHIERAFCQALDMCNAGAEGSKLSRDLAKEWGLAALFDYARESGAHAELQERIRGQLARRRVLSQSLIERPWQAQSVLHSAHGRTCPCRPSALLKNLGVPMCRTEPPDV